ncbi:hypothetical protein GJV26_01075 [Massilia dura]|uniref:Cell envelope biogenesis protein TolA n=1 Tax=Pseudoduganella dura TaxID=321982 RepID=A0A6I3X919_9BURK|nr:hypothetical protein [Pseudoduganella dura]MUI11090.1 hypothetical protein [Pseudoduganella dura]GGY03363.1 hypothetical protein GCM10007386_37860 [Pseudoduganella dura]
MHTKLIAAATLAALAYAGAASAQSHSVTNMANPPQTQSDSKAATEATPGRSATAHKNTNKQPNKNAGKDGGNRGNPSGSAKTGAGNDATGNAKRNADGGGKVETSGDSMTGERTGAGSSATATTGIGAGNGDQGAEGAMEIKPSEAYTNPVERRALDEAPKSGKK